MIKSTLAALALAALSHAASAQSYAFDCVTKTALDNCVAGESQLQVAISGPLPSQVLFTFTNTGPAALSLTDVYFDDGLLLDIARIVNGSGVSFDEDATPPNLPGGNAINFITTAGFSADSNPPRQPNGVNPGETLGILFVLDLGRTFSEVAGDLANGVLRIGIHVQGFEDGGSESFVNVTSPVPEAATSVYLLSAIGAYLFIGRMRRRTGRV